jgi:HEPN domain-containing protein
MSVEKIRTEAERWLKTAEGDLETAEVLMKNDRYAHACFHAQQSGEKSLKALWHFFDADPWGHSINKLLQGLEHIDLNAFKTLKPMNKYALVLDRFYIPTRYPNGLPEMTPEEAYLEEDAILCIDYAEKIIEVVRKLIFT